MANSRFLQFFYTKHNKPVLIDIDIPIGATGAVGTVAGAGVSSVTRLTTGVYQVNFSDNYNKYLGGIFEVWSPVTGSNVAATALSAGTIYTITALGTTTQANWVTAGVPSTVTAVVGTTFKAAATSSGNGTAKAIGVSGLVGVEIMGNPNTTVSSNSSGATGGYIVLQTLAATNSSTTTLIAADPASGSTLSLAFYFSDSSNVIANGG